MQDPTAAAQTRATWRVHGVETDMVGREAELESLVEIFREITQEGRVRTVLLVGAEGVGKSRLVDEFSQRVNTAFGSALLISGAWVQGSERAFEIVDRVLRSRFYIPHTLSEEEARERLLEGIGAIVKSTGAVEIAHRIGHLIELPFPDSPFQVDESPEESREAARRALANLIRIDAQSNPLVLVLEDLQFATPEALDLVPFMARELTDAPILCLVTTTEDFIQDKQALVEPIGTLETINLRELADSEIRSLVDQVLERAGSIPDLLYERVCSNANGNPLIAEEILRILFAEGAIDTSESEWLVDADILGEMNLPIGLHDVVEAGLGRLSAEERRLLEWAAVVGETFWAGALFLLHNASLDLPATEFVWSVEERPEDAILALLESVRSKDVIRLHDAPSYPDETEYGFKHAATHRALLQNLDDSERARVHGLVAVWHELNRERGIRETDAVIARHHERAGHIARASEAYIAAGHHATEVHLNDRAVGFYLKALQLLDETQPLKRLHILHEVGSLYDLMGEYQRGVQYLEEMIRWSWRVGSPSKGGAAHNKLGRAYRNLGEFDRAMEHFHTSVHLFRRANDHVGIASSLDDIGKIHWLKGNYRASEEHYMEGLALRREIGTPRSLALSLNNMGSLTLHQGKFKEALRYFRESLALRKEIGDQRGVGHSLNNLGVIVAERGDLEGATRLWDEALDVAREIGDRALEGMLLSNNSEIERYRGNFELSEKHLDAAAEIVEECTHRQLLFEVLRNRGLLELQRQNGKEALQAIERAKALAAELASPVLEGIALRSLGEVHGNKVAGTDEDSSHLTLAEKAFRTALEILTEVGNDAEIARTCLSYGLFLLEQGLMVQAKKRLDEAREIFSRLGMKRLLEQTDHYLSEL